MRLDEFISDNLDAILVDWVAFARGQFPAGNHMDEAALQDHGRLILEEIAANMRKPEGAGGRQAKSEGDSSAASGSPGAPSRRHARQREQQGFQIEQLVAEYRALRANVLRRWTAASSADQVQDLEDVIRFNEAVDQAVAESLETFVSEVNKSRDLFLGILGHDLRGPLSTISSCALLETRVRPTESRHATLILRSVAQMKALLDDLVEYTRHRLGSGLAIDPASLDFGRFARDTLDEINATSGGRALDLQVAGNLHGEWDPRRLHQALSNLVFNALKYGLPDAPIRVLLDGTLDDEVAMAVENTGRAIPPESFATLFDPLVRAGGGDANADTDTGTGTDEPVAGANLGLGLYVVREIAKAHGGSIDVRSDDSATRFSLRLPRITARRAMP